MYQIGIIMGGVMPVPAVCGGAIETLITSIVKQYSKEDNIQLTIFSVYHKEAVEASKKYPEVRFVWTHTNSFWNLAKHAVFLTIRETTGKTIRALQRHYNEIVPVIQKEKFDLLLVEGGDEQAVVDIASEYSREQLAIHAHIQYLPKDGVAKGYGHMIGVSEFVTNEYVKACKYPVDAHTLRNAIDVKHFSKKISDEEKNKIKKKLGINQNDFVVFYVGRLIQVKEILELMEAVFGLKDKSIKLLTVGSANFGKYALSSYEKKVKNLAEKNKEQIINIGYVDNSEIYKYASLADIQCVPSLWQEAAGLVVLEAMAEGIPTIVTRSGGMVEYVTEETSIIIEQKNVIENLKQAILFMKENPKIRKEMSEASKVQGKKFNTEIYYRDFVKIMKKIIGAN